MPLLVAADGPQAAHRDQAAKTAEHDSSTFRPSQQVACGLLDSILASSLCKWSNLTALSLAGGPAFISISPAVLSISAAAFSSTPRLQCLTLHFLTLQARDSAADPLHDLGACLRELRFLDLVNVPKLCRQCGPQLFAAALTSLRTNELRDNSCASICTALTNLQEISAVSDCWISNAASQALPYIPGYMAWAAGHQEADRHMVTQKPKVRVVHRANNQRKTLCEQSV